MRTIQQYAKRLLTQPAFWLIAIPAILLIRLWILGRLEPVLSPDSPSYVAPYYNGSSLSALLSATRTFGYPLFLKVVTSFNLGKQSIPVAQVAAFVVATWTFYWGLRQAGYRKWTATWCACSLFLSPALLRWSIYVLSDCLAMAWAVANTGCFLALCSSQSKNRSLAWCGFVATTFATYQTRPAYLFLIVLWPMLYWLLFSLHAKHARTPWSRLQSSIQVAAATTIPFVAWCTLRLVVVGHWGLVSYGSFGLIGICGQFVDSGTVAELPADLRPFAERIIARRSAFKAAPKSFGYDRYVTGTSHFAATENLNPTIFAMCSPAAEDLYCQSSTKWGLKRRWSMSAETDMMKINNKCTLLSFEILKIRPALYGRWIVGNLRMAAERLTRLAASSKASILLMGIFVVSHYLVLRNSPVTVASCAGLPRPEPRSTTLERHLVFWIAIGFAAFKTSLVILVQPAMDRFMSASGLLLPAAAAVAVAIYLEANFPRIAGVFETPN